MRKILFILLLAPFALKSQTVNTFRDSTWFKRGVRFDSTLVFSKGAGSGKVWTSNASGTGSWQTFSSAGVTQGALDDSISAVRAIRKVDTIYKSLDSIVFNINGIRYAVKDSSIITPIFTLTKNSTRDSIIATYNGTRSAVKDSSIVTPTLSYGFGVTRDTMVIIYNGVRTALRDSSGAGSSTIPLSSLTAATAINTINNGNFGQEWKFDSHVSGSAFKLSTNLTSAHTPVAGSAVLDVSLSNSYIPIFSGTNYAAKFVNNYYSTLGSAINVAGYFETGDPSGGVNSAVYAKGNIRIEASTGKLFFGNHARIFGNSGAISFSAGTSLTNDNGSYTYGMEAGNSIKVIRNYSSQPYYNWQSSYLYKDISTSRQVLAFGVDHDLFTTASVGNSYGWIERSADKLMFAAQAGLSSRTAITPNYLLTLYGTSSNVGIGTTTPSASAKLEVSSTTQGFLPPRMTSTQASAISSPAQGLMIFVTDTNGTFTSIGWWGYNGTTWEKLNN